MVIGSYKFDLNTVLKLRTNKDKLLEYCTSLVPLEYRHNSAILHNQRYYIYTKVVESTILSFRDKKEIAELLLENITVCGYLDFWISVRQLEESVNMKKVNLYWRKENE